MEIIRNKTVSPIYVIKYKRQCFHVFLDQASSLVLHTRFWSPQSSAMKKNCQGLLFGMFLYDFIEIIINYIWGDKCSTG